MAFSGLRISMAGSLSKRQVKPAISGQRGAGDEAGFVRREEGDGAGDLGWVAEFDADGFAPSCLRRPRPRDSP